MDVTHCKNLFGKANEELFLHVVENFRSFYYDAKINKSIFNNWFMLLAVHHRVMEHLGSLESTQEARVALGYASGNSYASFVLAKLPACSITRWCTLKHEPIVNWLQIYQIWFKIIF